MRLTCCRLFFNRSVVENFGEMAFVMLLDLMNGMPADICLDLGVLLPKPSVVFLHGGVRQVMADAYCGMI